MWYWNKLLTGCYLCHTRWTQTNFPHSSYQVLYCDTAWPRVPLICVRLHNEQLEHISKYVIFMCMSVNGYLLSWMCSCWDLSDNLRVKANMNSLHILNSYNNIFNMTVLAKGVLFSFSFDFLRNYSSLFPSFFWETHTNTHRGTQWVVRH